MQYTELSLIQSAGCKWYWLAKPKFSVFWPWIYIVCIIQYVLIVVGLKRESFCLNLELGKMLKNCPIIKMTKIMSIKDVLVGLTEYPTFYGSD